MVLRINAITNDITIKDKETHASLVVETSDKEEKMNALIKIIEAKLGRKRRCQQIKK